MKNCLCMCAVAGTIAGASHGEFIVVNNPVADTVGFYSDAFSSKGTYTYAQSGAQAFSLEDSYQTSSLRWWGSMNGFNGQGLQNIECFEVIVWDSSFDSMVVQDTYGLAEMSVIETGEENFFGQPVYEFLLSFSFQIAAGSYYMNIGAQLDDAAGDQFVWSQGEDVEGFWFTDENGTNKWGDWRPLPNFIGNTAGGAFVMTAPAPGAIAMAGLAGLVGKRRRAR